MQYEKLLLPEYVLLFVRGFTYAAFRLQKLWIRLPVTRLTFKIYLIDIIYGRIRIRTFHHTRNIAAAHDRSVLSDLHGGWLPLQEHCFQLVLDCSQMECGQLRSVTSGNNSGNKITQRGKCVSVIFVVGKLLATYECVFLRKL